MSEQIKFLIPTLIDEESADLIEAEIFGLGGVVDIEIEIEAQTVIVEWDPPASWDGIKTVLSEIEHPAGDIIDTD